MGAARAAPVSIMSKYRNLQDWKGSPDGVAVIAYPQGAEQELPPDLARAALDEGWVEEVKARKSEGGKGK